MGSSVRARIKKMRQRFVRMTRRVPSSFRRGVQAVDLWIQDHHVAVVVTMFVLLMTGAGALLWTAWEEVIGLAKELAPVVTIISIIASAFLGVIKWFRKRRAARIRRESAANTAVPRARKTESDRPASAPHAPSGSSGQEGTDGPD